MKAFYSCVILSMLAIVLTFLLGCFNGYFYPVRFKEEIYAAALEYDVSPALIASVANVESGYKVDSVSNSGAVGVMQLMPSTAEWLCQKIGLIYDEEKLVETEYNIRLGGYYLSYLLKQFSNQNTALCAYNAGPNKVREWLGDRNYSVDGENLTKIPFQETESYVIKVNKNLRQYSKKYK